MPLQDITIYHKDGANWINYKLKASFRNTSYLNRNTTGVNTTDNALIRVFDVEGYNFTWHIKKGDVIVNMAVSDSIENAPLTELRKKYGDENVYQVTSIAKFIFEDSNLKEINHIKIGAV